MRIKAHWCVKEWKSPLYSQFYEVSMLLLIFVIPLAIISFAYANICLELWVMTSRRANMRAGGNSEPGHEMSYVDQGPEGGGRGPIRLRRRRKPQADDDRTRKQVIKMLVTVITLFALCWGPGLIDNVLVAFGLVEKYNYDHLKHIRQAFSLMAYFNSCVNPIVYAFMSKNFRESFKHAICTCVAGERYLKMWRRNRQVSFHTRTSSMSLTTQPGQSLIAALKAEGDGAQTELLGQPYEHEGVDTRTTNCNLLAESGSGPGATTDESSYPDGETSM